MELPAVFPDSLEVLIYNEEAGPTLVAAVELISPANKDRPQTRRAFAAKCAAYLQQGIGLVTVDIVTERQFNLHNEFVRMIEADAKFLLRDDTLYALAYRPARNPHAESIQTWATPLAVGQPLAAMPLALDKSQVFRLDFDAPYAEACQRLRLPA